MNWTDPRIVFVLPMLALLMAWVAVGILLRGNPNPEDYAGIGV